MAKSEFPVISAVPTWEPQTKSSPCDRGLVTISGKYICWTILKSVMFTNAYKLKITLYLKSALVIN